MLRLTAIGEAFPLARPFRIARSTTTVRDVVTVTITHDGRTGRGEGIPYARYGESVAKSLAEIEAVRSAIEAGIGRDELQTLMPAGAARNAVDCALWDLAGDADPAPASVVTAMTIGIDTPDLMAAAAKAEGSAPLLKVKVDADNPEARVRAVRAVAPQAKLIVDPNESWNVDQVAGAMPWLAALQVSLLEQPVPADDDAGLASIEALIPIAADESVHSRDGLDQVAERYGMVNIKLDKTGGLTEALLLADAARARGLGVMTGCMICTSLSIAPALRVAALSDFADLDGPSWLANDRDGGVRFDAGHVLPPATGFWNDR
jgi:L-Ala-D/L-Glu epimerase